MNMFDNPIKTHKRGMLRGQDIEVGDVLFDIEDGSLKELVAITVNCAFVKNSDTSKIEDVAWGRLRTLDESNAELDDRIDEIVLENQFIW